MLATTRRCQRCSAVLPGSAQYCRRCGSAQIETPARGGALPPPLRSQASASVAAVPGKSHRTLLSILGLFTIGATLMLFVRGQSMPQPATVAPIFAAPPNFTPINAFQPSIKVDGGSQMPAVVYPSSPMIPVYPNHEAEHYRDRVREEHHH